MLSLILNSQPTRQFQEPSPSYAPYADFDVFTKQITTKDNMIAWFRCPERPKGKKDKKPLDFQ